MDSVNRVDILGCPFDAVSFADVVEQMRNSVRIGSHMQIVPGSIDFVVKAMRDRSFAELLWRADLIVADGVPIVWSASLLGTPIRGRVSGTELVWECARISAEMDFPVALIGAEPGIAGRAARRMMKAHPGAVIEAIPTPFPLSHTESLELATHVRSVGAKIVLAALGAPRQERWIQNYLDTCGANVGIGVGSAFDIISGDKPRAPRYLQGIGMEWFYRMVLEPRRLGRRYLVEDTPFLLYLARELMKRRFHIKWGRT